MENKDTSQTQITFLFAMQGENITGRKHDVLHDHHLVCINALR